MKAWEKEEEEEEEGDLGETKETEKEQEGVQRGGKERGGSETTSAGADHPFYRAAEVRDAVTYRCAGSRAHMHTQTHSAW